MSIPFVRDILMWLGAITYSRYDVNKTCDCVVRDLIHHKHGAVLLVRDDGIELDDVFEYCIQNKLYIAMVEYRDGGAHITVGPNINCVVYQTTTRLIQRLHDQSDVP